MIARFAPIVMLAFAITQLTVMAGCPKSAPAPHGPVSVQAPLVPVELTSPTRVKREQQTPPRAVTLQERETLLRTPGDMTDYVAVGERFMSGGRALEAIGAYRIALSIDNGAEVWRKLGEAYLAAGDDVRGLQCLEQAVSTDTGMVAARKALVKHHLAHADGAAARLHAEELVRLRPLDPAMRQMLGRALMQQRMWKEAISAFSLVVAEEPDNIFAHNNLGYSAIQIGELELAREHLERTLSLEPQHGYMLNNLGVTYERLGRQAEAHAAFSRAGELSPRYAQAKLNRDRLQVGLTQDERIVSSETLVQMREPTPVPPFAAGGDLVHEAMDAAAGGSARLAPALVPTGDDLQ